ncbi:MAG: hypothetical protein ACYTEO_19505, partial [Planctomycetota bacterium]
MLVSLRLPAAALVENHVPQVDVLVITREDLSERSGHVGGPILFGLFTSFRIRAVDPSSGQAFACLDLESI